MVSPTQWTWVWANSVKDREAWHASVLGVAKSWTQLSVWSGARACVSQHLRTSSSPGCLTLKPRCRMACGTMTEHRDSACPVSNPSLVTSVNSLSGPQLPHLSKEHNGNTYLTEVRLGISLAVQWLRLHLPMQGVCVRLIKTSKTIHDF